MKLKNLVALLLAVVMIVGCLAGCQQDKPDETTEPKDTNPNQTTTPATSEPSLFNVGSLPIVNEPITLKVLTQDPTNMAYDTADQAGIWAWLEEQTGIHFEVESYSAEELKQKLPLIMATPDDMPDLFIRCDLTSSDVMSYGQNGQLLMLDDLIETYGTNIKECLETLDYAYGATVSPDGHIYSLPSFNLDIAHCNYYINTRFLENCGITEVPTTLEGMVEAMKTMRGMDANGDGIVGNEILITMGASGMRSIMMSMVGLNCYWPRTGALYDANANGEVFLANTSEQYKYLLTIMADLYKEGILDNEVFTQSSSERTEKFNSDLVFMYNSYTDPDSPSYNGLTGWTLPLPVTSAVHDEAFYTIGAPYQTDIGAISAYTEYPEICMLVLDYMYGEDCSYTGYYGLEGIDHITVSEDPLVLNRVDSDVSILQGPTSILLPRWLRESMRSADGTALANYIKSVDIEYGKVGFQNYLKFTSEEAETISEITADLGLYIDDFFVGAITGEYDIEADWDEYVANCNKMRAEELTAIHQAAYNRFYGIE